MEGKATRFALLLLCGALLVIGIHRFTNGDETVASGVTVYVFLSEDCPISQSATLALNALHRECAAGKIKFVGVFANASSTEETITRFKQKYEMQFTSTFDNDNRLMRSLGAKVTPEAFIVDNSSQRILYKGRIDDSFAALGQRRQVVTSHELQEALAALTNGHAIAVKETKAVGCFITARE